MSENIFTILHIEDDDKVANHINRLLTNVGTFVDVTVNINRVRDLPEAKTQFADKLIDLVIIDLKLTGEEDGGNKILKYIKTQRFVPVIFFTALAQKVTEEPLVHVVAKDAGANEKLIAIITGIIKQGLSKFQISLMNFTESTIKAYMWDFINIYGEQMNDKLFNNNALLLKKLALRRLATELNDTRTAESLLPPHPTSTHDPAEDIDAIVQPIEFYVIPPISKYLATGDVIKGKINEIECYWVILHPTCDMIPRTKGDQKIYKADFVAVAEAVSLEEFQEYITWNSDNSKHKALHKLFHNERTEGQAERYWFLPGVLNIPNSVVDFQRMRVDTRENIEKLDKVASLDSPFAENLLTSYVRYKGRIGQPRLDTAKVIEILKIQQAPK